MQSMSERHHMHIIHSREMKRWFVFSSVQKKSEYIKKKKRDAIEDEEEEKKAEWSSGDNNDKCSKSSDEHFTR